MRRRLTSSRTPCRVPCRAEAGGRQEAKARRAPLVKITVFNTTTNDGTCRLASRIPKELVCGDQELRSQPLFLEAR